MRNSFILNFLRFVIVLMLSCESPSKSESSFNQIHKESNIDSINHDTAPVDSLFQYGENIQDSLKILKLGKEFYDEFVMQNVKPDLLKNDDSLYLINSEKFRFKLKESGLFSDKFIENEILRISRCEVIVNNKAINDSSLNSIPIECGVLNVNYWYFQEIKSQGANVELLHLDGDSSSLVLRPFYRGAVSNEEILIANLVLSFRKSDGSWRIDDFKFDMFID